MSASVFDRNAITPTVDPQQLHFRRLERLYSASPISRWYGSVVIIEAGSAEVSFPIRPEFLHAGAGVHGSVYFRALDDAAFFAANSREAETLLATVDFNVRFLRPVSQGQLFAHGLAMHQSGHLFFAQAELFDASGRMLATGSGTFTRTKVALDAGVGYC
jgi:uncharacterized protein (TIGR00369 family)